MEPIDRQQLGPSGRDVLGQALAWTAHGSRFCARANDDDYPAIANLLLDAGAARAESYNRWNEPPETLARPSVVAVLKARGLAV